MSNDIELEGVIVERLKGAQFKVEVNINETTKNTIICKLSGKIMLNNIKILLGDRVKVVVSPYNLNEGRIVYRFK